MHRTQRGEDAARTRRPLPWHMGRRLVLILHRDDPPDDRVATFAAAHGFEADYRRPYDGEGLGPLDESVAGTVLYGGGFEVYKTETYPFLIDEHRWVEQCMTRAVPVLGICQGAQSIAHVLGAHVGPPDHGATEFGCYQILPTPEGSEFLSAPMHVTQSHFHGFAIPTGAVRLAGNDAFPNQAFQYGKYTYGLQFHPEMTVEGFARIQDAPWARYGWPGAQTREEQDRLLARYDDTQARWFERFLSGLFA